MRRRSFLTTAVGGLAVAATGLPSVARAYPTLHSVPVTTGPYHICYCGIPLHRVVDATRLDPTREYYRPVGGGRLVKVRLRDTLRSIPVQNFRDRGRMAFHVTPQEYAEYAEELASRATALGDFVLSVCAPGQTHTANLRTETLAAEGTRDVFLHESPRTDGTTRLSECVTDGRCFHCDRGDEPTKVLTLKVEHGVLVRAAIPSTNLLLA